MIIDRYIGLELVKFLAPGIGLLILVFVGYSAAENLSLAADGKVDALTALKLIGLNTLITTEVLLPSCLFFTVLAVIGKFYRDSEMYALYAAGVSQGQVLWAVFKFAVVVALITGLVSIEGRPWAYRQVYKLEAEATQQFNLQKLAAGEFVPFADSGYVVYANGVDSLNGQHRDVFLYRYDGDNARTELIVSESMSMPLPDFTEDTGIDVHFNQGSHYLFSARKPPDAVLDYGTLDVTLPAPKVVEKYRRKAEKTTVLGDSESSKDIAEFQWRLSTPLATLLLAMIAVPLARTAPRQSRLKNTLFALLAYISLFSLISVLRTGVEQGTLPQLPGLWSAYIAAALLLLALFLLQRRGLS